MNVQPRTDATALQLETIAQQPEAAVRKMIGAGIHHNEVVDVELTIAIVPRDGVSQEAWFKPCAIRVTKRKGGGKGQQQPVDEGYLATIAAGLPAVTKPGFLRFHAEMCANGELTITPTEGPGRYVPAHQKLTMSGRWYTQTDALADMAQAYGCTPDAMFEHHGEEALVGQSEVS